MFRPCVVIYRRGAGIVGLPNVGKSTLFNALTCSQQAKTGNFPFCTIDANLSKVPVVDDRLRKLAAFTGASRVVDVEVDLADVAGLIPGASKGAGLGNKFLADIRPCTCLLHIVRCFESAKDGFGPPSPLEDVNDILTELILADLEVMERRAQTVGRGRKGGNAEASFAKKVVEWLGNGRPAGDMVCKTKEEARWLHGFQLLSEKPMLFVLNLEESAVTSGNAYSKAVEAVYGLERTCRISASIEEQTSQLSSREERLEFLKEYDITVPHGEVLMRKVYDMLHLQSFFTVGPQMAHGWPMVQGTTVRAAAGEIHSDFEKNFVRAKVMGWAELLQKPNLESAEMQMRYVDDKYVVNDGDVLIVEHSTPRA